MCLNREIRVYSKFNGAEHFFHASGHGSKTDMMLWNFGQYYSSMSVLPSAKYGMFEGLCFSLHVAKLDHNVQVCIHGGHSHYKNIWMKNENIFAAKCFSYM